MYSETVAESKNRQCEYTDTSLSSIVPRLNAHRIAAQNRIDKKKRRELLEEQVKRQKLQDWRRKERCSIPNDEFNQETWYAIQSVERLVSSEACTSAFRLIKSSVICLENIMESEHVRGLRCHHVFHCRCLDEWYERGHSFCPLCHHRIVDPVPKAKGKKFFRLHPMPGEGIFPVEIV
jgi:hypothetical protein